MKKNKKKLILGVFLLLSFGIAHAQTTLNMKDGTTTVSSAISFYDSYGPAVGANNYWNSYYKSNEEFVHTFKPGTSGYKVQVTFNSVEAFGPNPEDPDAATGISHGNWSVRLNDDFLYVYDGDRVDDTKLIAAYTGNSENTFTIVATGSTGALTFVFKSNGRYNEEGWAATVTQVATASAQAPFIRRATCENEIEMLPTTLKAKIYYTSASGSTPADPTISSTQQYRRPINFPAGSLTVKAISVLSTGGEPSAVASVTFNDDDHLTNPDAPTVSDLLTDNSVTMTAPRVPDGLNETYVVRYTMTTDGSTPADPSLYNSTEYTGPITITTPGTKIKARTFAKSCDNWYSTVVTKTFSTLTCPAPTITLNATEQKITFDGNYNLSYTTDGSEPTSTNGTQVTGDGSASQDVTLSNLALGTNVKAITYKTDYTASAVVSEFYSTGNTMTSTTVFLDDREDHNWSYYSDGDQPIHSLNPADVKITYYGNGTGTVSSTTTSATPGTSSWTGNATSAMVGINPGESQNTFVYLKTLERQNEDGSGNLPYTMIANPFQVRPIYTTSSKGTEDATPIINIIEPEPETLPEPVFVDPIIPEETEFSAERGNRSTTYTENFESYGVGTRPGNWTYSHGGGIHSEDPVIANDNFMGGSKYLQFVADGILIAAGHAMAVMPYYSNIESITFKYRVGSGTLQVGWYDGSNFQTSGQIQLTNSTATTITLNSSNAETLLDNVNASTGRRIAFRLYASGTLERDAGIDDLVITINPKAPAFNYADGTEFTGTSAPVTITRKAPVSVTYYKLTAADDNSEPSTTDGTWTSFDGNTQTVPVPANTPRLRAFAYDVASGTFSAVTDATYIFTLRAPTFSHNGGLIDGTSQSVTITGLDANTTVYYTMDGSDPLTSTTASSFAGGSSTTVIMGENAGQVHTQLRAIAVANNLASLTSAETSATYSFTLNAPEISPEGGLYFITGAFDVTITSHGGTLHYTTDGTDPTEESPTIASGGKIQLTQNATVKVKAFSLMGESAVVEETYTFGQAVTNNNQYRGFYKWRVKSKSSGLTLLRSNGTTEVAVGGTFDADEQIFFKTSNEYGNEVEFEALWALAYVADTRSGNSNGRYTYTVSNQNVGFERNFVVLKNDNNTYAIGGNSGNRITNTNNRAFTATVHYPNGATGTNTGARIGGAAISLTADTKFENISMNMASYTLTANGKNLTVGRGVTGTAQHLYGLNGSTTASNFNLRIESGTYTDAFVLNAGSSTAISSAFTANATFGCDYDRANNINTNLKVAGAVEFGFRVRCSNSNAKVNMCMISGTFGADVANTEVYAGWDSPGGVSYAFRNFEVYGGNFLGGIAGGIEANAAGIAASTEVLKMRVRGGNIHRYMYGSGQYSAGYGTRRTIITGGTFDAWIAGGCYGTESTGGATNGDTYVYFGGKANQTSTGGIFGAGYGSANMSNNSYTVNKSFVVMADEAQTAGNVFGGGNNGYNKSDAKVYVLGGAVAGNVYGGANKARSEATTTVTMNNGMVNGSLYGGANESGNVAGLATINVSGGSVTNVFGGGLGASTTMAAGTKVTVSGGEIGNNIYGGGEQGSVTGNTDVTFSGGSVNEVFGAGLGTENAASPWPPAANANITGNTTVTVSGGTVKGGVYGGGENGSVNSAQAANRLSKVTVSGGTVEGDVFGGGKNGVTFGNSIVTVSGGLIKLNVFGGALGSHGKVYFAGHKSVNILNGQIKGSVYGGSHDAHDALSFSPGDFTTSTTNTTSSNVNICGGQIEQHVYSAGYYGNTFGSVYSFIGLKAIEEAPNNNHDAMTPAGVNFNKSKLVIKGHVWAGGDWGTFSGGTFGGATITGNSNIYIDGLGYQSNDNNTTQEYYMKLKGSVMGCGTSSDAGKGENNLFVRNFGDDLPNTGSDKTHSPFLASTEITSIQKWHKVRIENSHLQMVGQGRITSLDIAEKYSLFHIDQELIIANGSSLVMNSPCDELHQLYSVKGLTGIYNATPSYTVVNYDGLGATGSDSDNKIRINNGGYLKVRYTDKNDEDKIKFGELKGFFHLMGDPQNSTDIYARPKQSDAPGNIIPDGVNYLNTEDGGFVSYVAAENKFNANGGTDGTLVQIPYENHVPGLGKNDSEYYRIWRYGGISHRVDAVLNAIADKSDVNYKTVTVDVKLPGWRDAGNYYRFVRNGSSEESYYTLIDYGFDVLTFNAANYQTADGGVHESQEWMYINGTTQTTGQTDVDVAEGLNKIEENPNLNFGLVVKPSNGMSGDNLIICSDATNYLANQQFGCSDVKETPTLSFELTFSNNLRSTRTNDPIIIPMVQCDAEGNVVDTVNIVLTIATSTDIALGSEWKMYAIMDGTNTNIREKAVLKVEIPKFEVYQSGKEAKFYIKKAEFTPRVALNSSDYTVNNSVAVAYNYHTSDFDINKFGLTLMPVKSTVSSDTWRFITDHELDAAPGSGEELPASEFKIGENGGRSPVSLDLALYYNANYDIETFTGDKPIHMGTVVYTLEFDNFAAGDENHIGNSTIRVDIYRKGHARCFYVDGVNGVDALEAGRGDNPNYAAKSINFLLNRGGYTPGDIIYIVNTVTTDNETTWDGSAYQNDVVIERYPGGHTLSTATGSVPPAVFGDNFAFTGTMVNVQGNLNLNGVTVDGHSTTAGSDEAVEAEAPMFVVENGGQLSLGNATTLQNNNNTNGDGGAVHVNYGGTLRMNEDATITNNVSAQGGGVFMDGTMIVSDHVQVTGNTSTDGTTASNVWLAPIANAGENGRVIQVGTADNDGFGPLSDDALIGVHKEDWGHGVNGYMPIVSAESGTEDNLDLPYQKPQTVIVPDQTNYTLQPYQDPAYLYWTSTWVTAVTSQPKDFNASAIDTPEELAWAISIVNGENGQTAAPTTGFTLTSDIDMSEHMWVPIGESSNPYTGTFNGNGHTVTGIGSTLGKDDMGMFGATHNATITDLVVSTNINSTSDNIGAVIGTMDGGTLSNVEGGGVLTSSGNSYNSMGGLVGTTTGNPTIHSGFSVVSVEGSMNSVIGGLVGEHYGNLYNAYSNIVVAENNKSEEIGGLVGYNNGHVENCYAVLEGQNFPAFAYLNANSGIIKYCYAEDGVTNYVGSNESSSTLSGHGNYKAVLDRKAVGYMYYDNAVTLFSGTTDYVHDATIDYTDNHKINWNGLLWSLNKWVTVNPEGLNPSPTPWFRPTTQTINGDLPVLGFTSDNSLATFDADGKFLQYGSKVNNNGIDVLLKDFADKESSIFLYGSATDVKKVPTTNEKVFINEDAALIQANNTDDFTAGDFINTTVGITFDNSYKNGSVMNVLTQTSEDLTYDWHLMSSPLQAASMGITYTDENAHNWWEQQNDDNAQVQSVSGSYFPDGIENANKPGSTTDKVTWDLYTFLEPEYHWINLKRNSASHYHFDGEHLNIPYTNETIFKPGRGYMMAINTDSYLSSTGTLTNSNFETIITYQSPMEREKGCNLLGNPYQAYFDLEAFFGENTDFNTAWVYIAESNKYVPYTKEASENHILPSQYLHPHQGFFVKTTADSTAVSFNKENMAKATGLATSYFRGERVNYPLVNLFAYNEAGESDFIVVEFNRPEIGGAPRMNANENKSLSLSAQNGQEEYTILFTDQHVKRVPVRFRTTEDGTFTLKWDTYHGTFSKLLLIDNITGTTCDMTTHDHYTFTGRADDYTNRFYIAFGVTGVEEYDADGEAGFAFFNGNDWVVTGEGQLQLIDVTGRILQSQYLTGETNFVQFGKVAAGVYMLRLGEQTQKIIIR